MSEYDKLKMKNEILMQKLIERDEKIKDLKEIIEVSSKEGENIMIHDGSERTIDYRDTRIIELAKKNKKLTVELNAERSRNSKAMEHINHLNSEIENNKSASLTTTKTKLYSNNSNMELTSSTIKTDCPIDLEIEEWKNKYNKIRNDLQLLRIKYEKIKSDFIKSNKIIIREIGEENCQGNNYLDKLLQDENAYKFRKEEIKKLK